MNTFKDLITYKEYVEENIKNSEIKKEIEEKSFITHTNYGDEEVVISTSEALDIITNFKEKLFHSISKDATLIVNDNITLIIPIDKLKDIISRS